MGDGMWIELLGNCRLESIPTGPGGMFVGMEGGVNETPGGRRVTDGGGPRTFGGN